jgi:hypothetical protein
VKTGTAGTITYQSANLRGSINPAGAATTYFFQYGPTAGYGSQSLPATVASGTKAVSVTSPISGLVPVTKYHFRLVAVNAVGTAVGSDATFTTAKIPLSLSIAALPNPVSYGGPVSIVGNLSGTGAAGRQVILQQNPFPFPGFVNVGNTQLTSPTGGFQFNLLSLPLTTQFRVVSVGGGQLVVSQTLTETVALGVTMHVSRTRVGRGVYNLRFSGTILPAENGARVSLQRLAGSTWRYVRATNAHASTPTSSSYTMSVRRRHGGFYRVFVSPIEGAHVANASQPLLVHVAGF